MKGFVRLLVVIFSTMAAMMIGADFILKHYEQDDEGRPYRVEAQRIAHKIENNEDYNLADYSYITNVEKLSDDFSEADSDYLIKNIGGTYYRFEYRPLYDMEHTVLLFNLCFSAMAVLVLGIMVYVYFQIIHPFEKLSSYPAELAKGNLTLPLREQKSGYFGKFLWGLDLLRETIEHRKALELALQKQNQTMVLSLSHDIKTPLGVIELYASALKKGLYHDEEKMKEIAVSIHGHCEDIRNYVDDIAKTAGDEFFDVEVTDGEFYLSELTDTIRLFYSDKLSLLKTRFQVSDPSDCLLRGDLDRSVEILQNIIENAIKYGDGKWIRLSFSREDDCQLIHITNSGCSLPDSELPHMFDSFWRGSNVGSQSGSGLGLYICRTILHKMNGDIYAEITEGNMTVTVVLPVR